MDTSCDPAFGVSGPRFWPIPGMPTCGTSLALLQSRAWPTDRAVRTAPLCVVPARIYNQMAREVTTPYVLVVEDDILPPLGVIDRLLHALDRNTAVVRAPFRRDDLGHYVAWDETGEHLPRGEGVTTIGGCGFGCVLLRTSVLRDATFSYGYSEPIDFDPAFCRRLGRDGWTIKIDWSQECEHHSVGIVS